HPRACPWYSALRPLSNKMTPINAFTRTPIQASITNVIVQHIFFIRTNLFLFSSVILVLSKY
ncbi:MAG: hypothetical protein KAS66_12585, partial [Candidatus Omnitrophica bacterium]|nr:hypothetical protein [Candidatus Omnitrophota bacterium]